MFISTKWIDASRGSSVEHARAVRSNRTDGVAHLMPMAPTWPSMTSSMSRLRVRHAAQLPRQTVLGSGCRPVAPWMKNAPQHRRAAGDARDLDVLADRLAGDYGEAVAPVIDLIAASSGRTTGDLARGRKCRNAIASSENGQLLHGIMCRNHKAIQTAHCCFAIGP